LGEILSGRQTPDGSNMLHEHQVICDTAFSLETIQTATVQKFIHLHEAKAV